MDYKTSAPSIDYVAEPIVVPAVKTFRVCNQSTLFFIAKHSSNQAVCATWNFAVSVGAQL